MDDTFIVWHSKEPLQIFLEHDNIQDSNRSKNSFSFLDDLVTHKSKGQLDPSFYRYPTHRDRYLHAQSHHQPAQKRSVVNGLVHQAISFQLN